MKTRAIKRSVVLGVLFAAVILLSGAIAFAYMPPEVKTKGSPKGKQAEKPQLELKGVIGKMPPGPGLQGGLAGQKEPEYEPGVVLVKFKEGASIQKVISNARLKPAKMKRVYSTGFATSKYKAKLKKNPRGQYLFNGKAYKSLKDISDEEVFAAAYKDMRDDEKALFRTYKIDLDKEENVEDAIAKLQKNSDVEYAEPNYIVRLQTIPGNPPNDPMYTQQWAHQSMESVAAWGLAAGGYDVIIAIIDTGVDYNHEDLAANMWRNPGEIPNNGIDDEGNGIVDDVYGYDYGSGDSDPLDSSGHGTFCAGIAGAVVNNGIGIAGVCPTAKIMAVKIFGGSDTISKAIQAIYYAINEGAKVISCSFGTYGNSAAFQGVVTCAYNSGCFVVAGAGNDHSSAGFFPAHNKDVFAVAALDANNNMASFSNYGTKIGVAAPGVNILSTDLGNSYTYGSGTSFACPHVAGEAALLFSKYPAYTPAKIANMIRAGAVSDIISSEYLGAGRANSYNALSKDSPYFDMLVSGISAPLYYDMFGGDIPVSGTAAGASYTLSYATNPYLASWTQFAQGNSVSDGLLGTFLASSLNSGDYFTKLTVTDAAGYQVSSATKVSLDKEILSGWPQGTAYGLTMSPVCADFDNDGEKETLAITTGNQIFLWRNNGDITPGFPMTLSSNTSAYNTPAVADLDNDGDLEIVYAAREIVSSNYNAVVFAYHHDLTPVSGWPVTLSFLSSKVFPNNAAIGDINGDGQPEIILTMHRSGTWVGVYVFDRNGNNLFGWPLFYSGLNVAYDPVVGNSRFAVSNPALADIDKDAKEEVIFAYSNNDKVVVNVFRGDATPLPGWPQERVIAGANNTAPVSIAAGDVNNDGWQELFFATWPGVVYGMDRNGNDLPGWPQNLGENIRSSVSLADLDDDGYLEIIGQTAQRRVFVYRRTGVPSVGWPKQVGDYTFGDPYSFNSPFASAPVIGDIDADRFKEIVVGSSGEGELYAFDRLGNVKQGFPRIMGQGGVGRTLATPSLEDFIGDGKTDVIIGSFLGKVYAWKFGNLNLSKMDWPTFGHNLQRTYCYTTTLVPHITRTTYTAIVGGDLTITGNNFGIKNSSAKVSLTAWDGSLSAYADLEHWSNTLIRCRIPILPAGDYKVRVINRPGPSNWFPVIFDQPAVFISSLSLTSGEPGANVEISGSGFGSTQGSSAVKFGDTPATVTSWGASLITCTVPIMPGGIRPVTVKVGANTSNGVKFLVNALPPPVIVSLSSVSGPAGAMINIIGYGFGATQGTSQVKFGDTVAIIRDWSSLSITATVPVTFVNGIYPVTVTTSSGVSNVINYTVTNPTNITGITPSWGPIGTTIILTGTGFGTYNAASSKVRIYQEDGYTQPYDVWPIASWNETTITINLPSMSERRYVIKVRGALQGFSNGVYFTAIALPVITSVTPSIGNGATLITLDGNNFGEPDWFWSRLLVRESPGEGDYGSWIPGSVGGSWSNTRITFPLSCSGVFLYYSDKELRFKVRRRVGQNTVVSNSVIFNVRNVPILASMGPAHSGPFNSEVNLTGHLFGAAKGANKVKFGTTEATTIRYWDNYNIGCNVPNLAPGTYPVTVTNPNGSSAAINYTVIGPARIRLKR